ncbi:hypothetical protein QBC42DRAFT_270048 [Cladorrhinum samala]|uniref:Zn(2)-C6 fungal-type domain-containing protein n=1 Tax=Cladorrhinum samala TaxID=585594 RepID=A0AAV9HNC9_9PEZI|nr:hypothetical protein QBC42DRAFT_270048 [Cladorrhinum samala]
MSEALPPPSQSQSQSQSPQAQSRQQSVNQYSPQAAQQQQPELTYEIIPHPRRNDTTAARALPEAGSRSQAAGVRKHQRRVGSKGGNQGKHQQTCVACKIAHKMCVPAANGAMICQRCQRQAYSMSRLGCVYFSIVDITLFRTMTDPISHKAYTSLTISQQLCGRVERRLLGPAGSHLGLGLSGGRGGGGRGGRGGLLPFKLTQGFGTYLHLEAQRFDVNDIISTEQLTPSEQDLYSHPYSIAGDYLTLKKACEDFVRDSKGHYIAAKTSSGDALTQNMFKAAIGYAANKTSRNDKDHEFLRTVLNFWTAARTIEGGWRLEGPEFLGLVPDENGQVPLRKAPYIDYQFSSVMVQHVLFPLRDSVLKQLNSMILSKAANHWFVIFLSTFILLHTCTLLLQQQRDFTRRRGTGKERYSNMKLVTSIHEAAKTLLAFFHQICKGKTLLDVDWERAESVKRIARISEIEANFLKYLVGVVEKRVDEFANLAKTDDYHADLWFTGQMFVRDWKPPYVSDVSPSCQG